MEAQEIIYFIFCDLNECNLLFLHTSGQAQILLYTMVNFYVEKNTYVKLTLSWMWYSNSATS